MRKSLALSCAVCLALALFAVCVSPIQSTASADGLVRAVSIRVAPATLAMESAAGVMTVHAGIRYTDVSKDDTVMLDVNETEIPALYTFADDRGNLVAKFDIDAVKAEVRDDQEALELMLTGKTTDGDWFVGSATIAVKPGSRR